MRNWKKRIVNLVLGLSLTGGLLAGGNMVQMTNGATATDSESIWTKKVVRIDKAHFPSLYSTLKKKCYDSNQDGYFSEGELNSIGSISVASEVSTLKGISYFPYLSTIHLKKYTGTTLTISKSCKSVAYLFVSSTKSKLTINAPGIKHLTMQRFNMDSNNVISYTSGMYGKKLKSLNLTNCTGLQQIEILESKLSSLRLPKRNNNLRYISMEQLNVKSLNFSNYPNLGYLCLGDLKKVTSLSFPKNGKLRGLELYRNAKLKKVDVSKCKNLKYIYLYGNRNNLKANVKLPKKTKVRFTKDNTLLFKLSLKYKAKY